MTIELTEEQLLVLRAIVEEYTDYTYSSVLEYHKSAMACGDEQVKKTYLDYAAAEEEKHNDAKELRNYLTKYEI